MVRVISENIVSEGGRGRRPSTGWVGIQEFCFDFHISNQYIYKSLILLFLNNKQFRYVCASYWNCLFIVIAVPWFIGNQIHNIDNPESLGNIRTIGFGETDKSDITCNYTCCELTSDYIYLK